MRAMAFLDPGPEIYPEIAAKGILVQHLAPEAADASCVMLPVQTLRN